MVNEPSEEGVDAPEWEGDDLRQDLMRGRAGLQKSKSSHEQSESIGSKESLMQIYLFINNSVV